MQVSQIFVPMSKYPRETTYKEESLLGLTVSEGSDPVIWLLCLWACGEAEHHGGSTWERKAAHLTVAKKQREEGGDRPKTPFESTLL
jgi:hypothetical protein